MANQGLEERPLVIRHLSKVFGDGKAAVNDVTFSVPGDRVFGLLGPNGAGKTTLLQIASGLLTQTKGSITANGLDTRTQMDKLYESLGYCPQHDIFWRSLSVEDHLLFVLRMKGAPKSKEKEMVDQALRMVCLEPLRKSAASTLSGGEKRRLSISMAFVGEPRLVLLDEPTVIPNLFCRLDWILRCASSFGALSTTPKRAG